MVLPVSHLQEQIQRATGWHAPLLPQNNTTLATDSPIEGLPTSSARCAHTRLPQILDLPLIWSIYASYTTDYYKDTPRRWKQTEKSDLLCEHVRKRLDITDRIVAGHLCNNLWLHTQLHGSTPELYTGEGPTNRLLTEWCFSITQTLQIAIRF